MSARTAMPFRVSGPYHSLINDQLVREHMKAGASDFARFRNPLVLGWAMIALACPDSVTFAQDPTGACCDWVNTDADGEAICRDVTEKECPPPYPWYPPQWQEKVRCYESPFELPCGKAACCHYQLNPNTNQLEQVCSNLTKAECARASPEGRKTYWMPRQLCGQDQHQCPYLGCVGLEGRCDEPHDTPGCCDEWCCTTVCTEHGSVGSFCCNISWDGVCVNIADEDDCFLYPRNNTCIPEYDSNCNDFGPTVIPVPGSVSKGNTFADSTSEEPGFCCHGAIGRCEGMGSPYEDLECVTNSDCGGYPCIMGGPEPWKKGHGIIWFKFTVPENWNPQTFVRVDTCSSQSPALDTLLQVYSAIDNSSLEAACNSLVPIACNDDTPNCSTTGRNSRVCLRNLTPGATYYVTVAAKTRNRMGSYKVTIATAGCSPMTPPCPNCPDGKIEFVDPPEGVVDARRPYPPKTPENVEGIRLIQVTGPPEISPACWSKCDNTGSALTAQQVTETSPGTYQIDLGAPLKPGSNARLTYLSEDRVETSLFVTSHPGNVNADTMTNTIDILLLVDHLNGIANLPFGLYSGDLDRSGMINPQDIVTLIDLLNGVGGYQSWYGSQLPPSPNCP